MAALGSRANSVINASESHICVDGAVVDADPALAADEKRWPDEPSEDEERAEFARLLAKYGEAQP